MGLVKLAAVGRETSYKWDHMGRTQIIQIIASYGPDRLNSLQFLYLDQNPSVHASRVIGSPRFTGSMFNTFTFGGSHEHITKVEGLYNNSVSRGFLTLRIHTNVKEYVICDLQVQSSASDLQSFSFNFGGMNQFGGFHGSEQSSLFVSSIGVYFKQLTVLPPSFLQTLHQDEDEPGTPPTTGL